MRILALDPGSMDTGWVLIGEAPPAAPLRFGVDPNAVLSSAITLADFDLLAIESIPAVYGHSALPALCDALRWEGRFIERAERANVPVQLVARQQVKAWLCSAAHAKDGDVRAELIRRWGGDTAIGKKAARGPLYGITSHVWPALAVGAWAQGNFGEIEP